MLSKKYLKKSEKISNLLFDLRNKIKNNFKNTKLIKSYKNKIKKFCDNVEYFEILNYKNLSNKFTKKNFKIFVSYKQNNVRLIDNI